MRATHLRVLDLVVVDLAVEAHDDGPHVLVVRQRVATLELDLLARIRATANPRHTDQVELLLDAHLADDVHLLAGLLELGLLEVGGGREGGREDVLSLGHIEPKAAELAQVALAALGRVVGHEENLLAGRLEHIKRGRDAVDEGVALPLRSHARRT